MKNKTKMKEKVIQEATNNSAIREMIFLGNSWENVVMDACEYIAAGWTEGELFEIEGMHYQCISWEKEEEPILF